MDTHKKTLGSCNQYKRRICAKKGEGLSTVKKRKGGGVRVYFQTVEERVYQTFKVTSNHTSIFHREEGWEKGNGSGLLIFK